MPKMMNQLKMLLSLVTAIVLFLLAKAAFAQETEIQPVTGNAQIDNVLQWVTIVMILLSLVSNALPDTVPGVKTMRDLSTNFRAIADRIVRHSKSDNGPTNMGPLAVAFVAVTLISFPATGCAYFRDSELPDVSGCAPEKDYLIEKLEEVLSGENWEEVLDRVKDEKGEQFLNCALSKVVASDAALRLKQKAILYMSK